MASVFQKPGSPYWYAAYTDASGTRVQKSTKEKKRSTAMDIARAWEKLAQKGRAGALTAAQARKVVSEIVETALGEQLEFHTAKGWLDEWIAGKRGTIADKTMKKYEQVRDDFVEHLADRADLPLAAISVKDVRSFRDARSKAGLSPATVNQIIRKVLSVPFAAAHRQGFIPLNPCVNVDSLTETESTTRDTFTVEQVRSLIKAADDEWKGAIICGFTTGLRLKDISDMTWAAADLSNKLLRIRPQKTAAKGVELLLPLHEDFEQWLSQRPRGIAKAPIFPKLFGRGTGGKHGLSGRFKAIMEKAGVVGRRTRTAKGEGRTLSSLSFHSLRHSFVSALANAGVAREIRQTLSGHSDDASHTRYTHHEVANLRGAVEKLPSVAD